MDALGPTEKVTDAENNNIGSTENRFNGSTSSSSLANAAALAIARNRNPALHPTRGDSPYPSDAHSTTPFQSLAHPTREDSPYPSDAPSTTPFLSLAESAANAQLQLQQQINLMAQV